jgi:Cu/Ag efflux protein CusF
MYKKTTIYIAVFVSFFLITSCFFGCRSSEPKLDLEDNKILQAEGIFNGPIDNQSVEIKISSGTLSFKVDEGVSVETIPDGSRVAITYQESSAENTDNAFDSRPLLLSIVLLEEESAVFEGEGDYIGMIDNNSVEIDVEDEIKVFRLAEGGLVEELETGLRVRFQYQTSPEGNLLLSIEPVNSSVGDERALLVGEGQLIGLIDAQSVEIKINRAFMLDSGVNIDNLEEGDLVAFTFRESGMQAIVESIKAVDQPLEGDFMHGSFIGRIDGQSIEIEYFQAFAIGENVSLAEIEDGEEIVFTYCEGEYRPLLTSVNPR